MGDREGWLERSRMPSRRRGREDKGISEGGMGERVVFRACWGTCVELGGARGGVGTMGLGTFCRRLEIPGTAPLAADVEAASTSATLVELTLPFTTPAQSRLGFIFV